MSWKDRESGIWQLYRMGGGFVLGYNSKMTNAEPLGSEGHGTRNLRAAVYMLVSIFFYALVPVFITWGEGHKAPFMYNTVILLFLNMGISIFLFVFYRRQILDREIWEIVRRNWRRWSLLGVLLGVFQYAVFGWALRYINVSVASVLYATWPLWMILLTGKMFKSEGRHENVGTFGWVCLLMGFAGLGFVVLCQTSDVTVGKENMSWLYLFLGMLLALIAAGIAGLSSGCSIRWGVTVFNIVSRFKRISKSKNASDHEQKEGNRDLTIFFVLMSLVLATIPGIIIGAVLSILSRQDEIVEADNMAIAAILGLFISLPAGIFFRQANIITTRLEINAMSYGTPVLTLAWLFVLGYISVPRTDWLIIGTLGVVAANALLNFKAEQRLAYQSLVVALWVCGVVVYFRSFFHAPVFYETVAVVTTMFILILSFRIDRLVRRTSAEDEMTLKIWQKISSLPEYMQDKLCEIDEAHTTKKLGDAYKNFRDSLKTEYAGDKEKFSDIMQQANILAHSKQQGDNFGEHAVLWILGGVSAGGLLFFMPESVNAESGAGGFFLEMAAFLVAATVIFLLFNIQDLQQDRTHQVFRTKSDTENPDEKNKYEGLVFREDQDRTAARRISVVFCVGIVATFGVLFWFKWMPT